MLKKVLSRVFPVQFLSQRLLIPSSIWLTKTRYLTSNNKPHEGSKYQQAQGIKVDKNLKQESKQFYNQQVQKIVQLKKSSDLNSILASSKQFVVLDLYAQWCEPCKILTPKLQQKVNSIDNVKLVKINIDTCPEVAQALRITTVPSVFLVHMSQPIQKIQGNVSQYQFNKFFSMIDKVKDLNPQISKIINTMETAKQMLVNQKKPEQAVKILQDINEKNINLQLIAFKALLLSRCYFLLNKISKFRNEFSKAEIYKKTIEQTPNLLQLYNNVKLDIVKLDEQQKIDPKIKTLKQKINKSSNKQKTLQLKYELVIYYKQKQMLQNSLQLAMQIIKQDKFWSDKKTNKLILNIFKELGQTSPIVQKYRRIFQRILY